MSGSAPAGPAVRAGTDRTAAGTPGADAGAAGLAGFLAAAPQPQRAVLRALLALQRRHGGRLLLRRAAPLEQLAHGLLAMAHWDEPANARALGWDADAVVARGRALRCEEGRP